MVSKQLIGKVAIVPKGVWNQSTRYEPLDLVVYGSSSFIALQAGKGKIPNSKDGESYWELVAAGGAGTPKLNAEGILSWTSP